MRPLEGKIALITGASRGIGAAIARNLASKGSSLVLNYTSDSPTKSTAALAKELEALHSVRCLVIQADMGDPSGPALLVDLSRKAFQAIHNTQFTIHILINNAGVVNNARVGEIKIEDFEWMYKINVLGPLLLMQAVMPYLPYDRSGRVINLSSISSTEGFIGQSVYGGTKAALEAMTRTWARELAERGTVNAINPGPVKTDMWNQMPVEHKGGLKPWTSHSPMASIRKHIDDHDLVRDSDLVGGRPAYPSEIAGIVGMLCYEDSVWCTGQVVSANGGMRMAI